VEESSIRLTCGDLDRLLGRQASRIASGFACSTEGGDLRVAIRGARVPRLEPLASDLTLAVRATLAPGERNVAVVTLRLHEAPFGLAAFLAPFVDGVVEGLLDERSREFVSRIGPSTFRVDLSRVPVSGGALGELLRVGSLAVPGAEPGEAARVTIRLEG
jgi:hypothetical protein